MVKRRINAKIKIELTIWKRDGELWYAERTDLEKAIQDSGQSEDTLRRKLGAGYSTLQDALAGKRLNIWETSHIEWGLKPSSARKPFRA